MNSTTTLTEENVAKVVARYVELVKSNDTSAAVIEAIDNGEGSEIIYELLDTSWDLGLRSNDEPEDTIDAWWDACEEALPQVVKALS